VLLIVVVVPAVVTGADAVMYVAPSEALLAAFKVTEATPLTSVNAVAEVGVNATRPLDAAKVTTAFFTNAPLPSLSIAVTVTGVPDVILEGTLKLREPRLVVVGPVPVPVLVVSPLPHPLRQQNRAKQISSSNGRRDLVLIVFTILLSFF
jgi:hypothetical protein